MQSSVETGADGRASEFVRTLDRLKRSGCNLLLVGNVPDDVLAAASRKLLGDALQRRFRLFVLTDADDAVVRDRLPAHDLQTPARTATIIAHETPARTATATDGERATQIDRIDVDGGLPELAAAIDDEIASFEAESDGLGPAQMRLSFDSLQPICAAYDRASVSSFLESVTERVRSTAGMAHYVLPLDREHELVTGLTPYFDAVIEYQVAEGGQERWHIPETGLTTGWLSL